MIIFLILYILYGMGHLYLFLKLKTAFLIESTVSILLILFLLFMMTLSPFFVHLYGIRGPGNRVRTFAYIGYIWLSMLLIFCAISVPIDVYNYALKFSGFIFQKDLSRILSPPAFSLLIPALLSVALTIYGYFEAKGLNVRRLTVETSKLPEGTKKLTIAHMSDLHLGIILRDGKLNQVLKVIESARPDLIVSTGDLLDAEVNHVDYLSENLKKVYAPLGKFAVTGNHEFYGGIKHAENFIKASGFTLLRGEGITVQNLINIAGVDDPTGKHYKLSGSGIYRPEKRIFSQLSHALFTILLKHRPSIDKDALGLFDLQLSGHAHKGQFFFIRLITKLFYRPDAGYAQLQNGSAIYVSSGAGTAGPPVRLFSPPEITIIEVVSTNGMQKNANIN